MAEAYVNARFGPGWRAFSAGSQPTGTVHPQALALLARHDMTPEAPSSKSWDKFATSDAPDMSVIVTVCDNAAGETCPVWPGRPTLDHWPFPDPAAFEGVPHEVEDHFEAVFGMIRARIDAFMLSECA